MKNIRNPHKQTGSVKFFGLLIIFSIIAFLIATKTDLLDQILGKVGTNDTPAEVIDKGVPAESATTTPESTSE